MLSPLPRHGDWVHPLLASPVVSAFPDMAVGSARASTFSRLIRRSLALRPAHSRCHHFVTRITEGFNYFVTSTVAPVASGWSICRVGVSPTGKRRLFTAHAKNGPLRSRMKGQRAGGGIRALFRREDCRSGQAGEHFQFGICGGLSRSGVGLCALLSGWLLKSRHALRPGTSVGPGADTGA
jgi:hypothetical protein